MPHPVSPEAVGVLFAVLTVALVAGLLIGAQLPSSPSPSVCEPNGGLTPVVNISGSSYCFEKFALYLVPHCDNGTAVSGSPIGAEFWSFAFELIPGAACPPPGVFCSLCGPGVAVLVREPGGTELHGAVGVPAVRSEWFSPDLHCGVRWQIDTVNVTLYVAVGA